MVGPGELIVRATRDPVTVPEVVQALSSAGMPVSGAYVAYRVFGDSLSALGSNLGKWTDQWSTNFLRISERAEKKLGEAAAEDGEVPPRILQRVMTDGAWCDDPVAQDYFAGLVAGSRTADGQDDSNLPTITLLAGLGSREIRAHYVIHLAIRKGLQGGWALGMTEGRNSAQLYLPFSAFAAGMGTDVATASRTAPEIIATLTRYQLLADDPWSCGPPDHITKGIVRTDWEAPAAGFIVSPSWGGLDLALKADGPTQMGPSSFLFGVGWTGIPEVTLDVMEAGFPAAPRTFAELTTLRESTGAVSGSDEVGWALPSEDASPTAQAALPEGTSNSE